MINKLSKVAVIEVFSKNLDIHQTLKKLKCKKKNHLK